MQMAFKLPAPSLPPYLLSPFRRRPREKRQKMKGLDRRSKAGPFFGRSVPDAGILSFAVLQRIALCNDMGQLFEASFSVD